MIDLQTITENVQLLISLGEINVVFVAMLAYLTNSYTDIFKIFFPEKKRFIIPFAWILAIIFSLLLILGGTVGVTILAILIVGSVIVKTASGDHAQKKAIDDQTKDYEPGQLTPVLPEDIEKL